MRIRNLKDLNRANRKAWSRGLPEDQLLTQDRFRAISAALRTHDNAPLLRTNWKGYSRPQTNR
jgi:hypothetical protein